MRQKGSERGRFWAQPNLWILLLLVAFTTFVVYNRDPGGQLVRYGELKQALQAPGVTVRSLTVKPTEIRGEFVTRDRASGFDSLPADAPDEAVQVVPFRT